MTGGMQRHRLTVVVSALLALLVASTALAAVPGDPFNLGVLNTIEVVTTLRGAPSSPLLSITNTGTGTAARAIAAANTSATSSTIVATNSGGGPVLSLNVNAGKEPMTVNSTAGKATNLNADKLDGLDSAQLQRRVGITVTVAKSGGDYTSIQAALNGITDASSTKSYLVRVGPGVYTGQVTMKPYVDI